jgi:glycosyltransferase involved in cell wall biosynthesis
MLEARRTRGAQAELFSYGAQGYAWTPSFALHRGPDNALSALRSGPSWTKVLADLRMAHALPRLSRRRAARVLIAHHVEAMVLACRMRELPRVFFAHTDLAAELPSYAAPRFAGILRAAGALTDRVLCTQADAIAAISPALRDALQVATGLGATYVPTPWPVPEPIRSSERISARHALGLHAQARVALYAGNLDAYQDAEQTLAALERLAAGAGPRLCLLLATNSGAERFLARARRLGVPCRTHPLGDEPVRRLLHAAADLAIVPRATPGGLPMKLLDALARGLPCALAPLAAAGLALRRHAEQAHAPGPDALAAAVARLCSQLSQPEQQRQLSENARTYIATEHNPERFHSAFEHVLAQARSNRVARPEDFAGFHQPRSDIAGRLTKPGWSTRRRAQPSLSQCARPC